MGRGIGFIQQPDKHINGPAGQLVPKKRPPARGTGEGGEHGLDSDGATIDDEREHSSAVQRNKTLLKAKTPPSTQKFTDRKSVESGKSVSVRVDIGGDGIIKKKTNSMKNKY